MAYSAIFSSCDHFTHIIFFATRLKRHVYYLISTMRKKYLASIIVFCLLSQFTFATQIFRSEDLQGGVTYSDTATAGAKQIDISFQTSGFLHRISKVYDGDTIILENGKRVRLLGINAPEIESRYRTSEPGGIAAKSWLQEKLQNKKVHLQYDQEKHDRYKRLLAHIFLPDGKHLNEALLENGLAVLNIIPPNLRHSAKLVSAQQRAEKQKLGIWSMPRYQPLPISKISNNNRGWQRYVGTPKSIKKSRKYSRLIFNEQTNIRIANENLEHFPKLENYLGKSIEIRGWISRNGKNYSMLVRHPSALVFH
jgi:endonuclease YncB( thermonuclease family)